MRTVKTRRVRRTRRDGRSFESVEVIPAPLAVVSVRSLDKESFRRFRRLGRLGREPVETVETKKEPPTSTVSRDEILRRVSTEPIPIRSEEETLTEPPPKRDPVRNPLTAAAVSLIAFCLYGLRNRETKHTCTNGLCTSLAQAYLKYLIRDGDETDRLYLFRLLLRSVSRVCWRRLARVRSAFGQSVRDRRALEYAERRISVRLGLNRKTKRRKLVGGLASLDLYVESVANDRLASLDRRSTERLGDGRRDYLQHLDLSDYAEETFGHSLADYAEGKHSEKPFLLQIVSAAADRADQYLRQHKDHYLTEAKKKAVSEPAAADEETLSADLLVAEETAAEEADEYLTVPTEPLTLVGTRTVSDLLEVFDDLSQHWSEKRQERTRRMIVFFASRTSTEPLTSTERSLVKRGRDDLEELKSGSPVFSDFVEALTA